MDRHKKRFRKLEDGNCKFSDVVGIIDWSGLDAAALLANKGLLIAAEEMLCAHFPHLIHRLYHINMPLDFEKVEATLKGAVSAQTLRKSIFLESQETFQRRADWMKLHGKASVRRSRISRNNRKRVSRLKSRTATSTKQVTLRMNIF